MCPSACTTSTAAGLVIDLQPGKQLLKGKELEGFLRWRNDGRDFGRWNVSSWLEGVV